MKAGLAFRPVVKRFTKQLHPCGGFVQIFCDDRRKEGIGFRRGEMPLCRHLPQAARRRQSSLRPETGRSAEVLTVNRQW